MTMRVSLAPIHPRTQAAAASEALLDPRGARVVLGTHAGMNGAVVPIAPAADTLFGPRGACLAHRAGPLFVCDTGHHRVLAWSEAPASDGTAADFLIGQPDFRSEGRNARGEIGPTTFNVPTGIAVAGDVLAVADAWNHRVLLWHGLPRDFNQPADVVLGQVDFGCGSANRGQQTPRADTLHWCYGVLIHDGHLFVADSGNRRVLVWNSIPQVNGAPADLVLGQRDFATRDEGASEGVGNFGMRWPHAIAVVQDMVLVADAGSSRIVVWRRLPAQSGAACDFVLGQSSFTAFDHNRGAYYPTASTLNMPYGLAVHAGRLVVADTANSRLLGFDIAQLGMSASAARLAGQIGFEDKGDNRWSAAAHDSLCWPYSVAPCDRTLVIADTGNNRVLLWDGA
jgi:hypothetical protein